MLKHVARWRDYRALVVKGEMPGDAAEKVYGESLPFLGLLRLWARADYAFTEFFDEHVPGLNKAYEVEYDRRVDRDYRRISEEREKEDG